MFAHIPSKISFDSSRRMYNIIQDILTKGETLRGCKSLGVLKYLDFGWREKQKNKNLQRLSSQRERKEIHQKSWGIVGVMMCLPLRVLFRKKGLTPLPQLLTGDLPSAGVI